MQPTLLNATDILAHMIVAARSDLAMGRNVDLTSMERVAASIYRVAADNPDALRGDAALVERLEGLMLRIGELEDELVRRHGAHDGAQGA
jgi:hypothetical protein